MSDLNMTDDSATEGFREELSDEALDRERDSLACVCGKNACGLCWIDSD